MDEIKKGGKRNGAGRKPLDVKKKAVTIYVPENKILLIGGEGKLKDWLNDSVDIKIQDLTKPTGEIRPFEQPSTNFGINTQPPPNNQILSSYEGYRQLISKSIHAKELQPIIQSIKSDPNLTPIQKSTLESLAKHHSKDFYND
jgi:hypothetical protein